MRVLITGGAGYIGGMLVARFLKESQVEGVFSFDFEACPEELSHNKKLIWFSGDLADQNWIPKAEAFNPDVVIHTAFKIRQGYGRKLADQERFNLRGSKNVFEFCFNHQVKKLVYFSSISAYGAYSTNSISRRLNESDPLKESKFVYGLHKKEVEEDLRSLYEHYNEKLKSGQISFLPQVLVVRPSSISGPRAKSTYSRFGLLDILTRRLPFIPSIRPGLVRQFVHEDDIEDAVAFLVFESIPGAYEIFNLSSNEILTDRDIGKLFSKPVIKVPQWLAKIILIFTWHLSRGKIPVPPEAVRFLAYPIPVDGTKINHCGFQYRYSSTGALLGEKGRYKSNG